MELSVSEPILPANKMQAAAIRSSRSLLNGRFLSTGPERGLSTDGIVIMGITTVPC